MADSDVVLNPGAGGSAIDAEKLAGAGPGGVDIFRQRVEIAGAALVEIVKVLNAAPAGTEYGLVTRNIPSGFQNAKVTDGTNTAAVKAASTPALMTDPPLVVTQSPIAPPTFLALYAGIAPAANKYMATLFNTSSTRKVVVQRIWAILTQIAAAAGATLEQHLETITARTAGSTVTPTSNDSSDSLSAGITADTGSTAVTDGNELVRFIMTGDQVALGDNGTIKTRQFLSNALVYEKKDFTKGLTLRQNQGLSIKNITSNTTGTMSYLIEFTDEGA